MADPSALEGGATVRQGWPSMSPIAVGQPSPSIEPVAPLAEYRNLPYRPDSILDGWSDGCFTVRAASLRGVLHRYHGTPRQDDIAVLSQSGRQRLIVAVADGVSGAAQSHVGASTAVRYASQWLDSSLPEDLCELDWRGLFESAAWSLVQQAALLSGAEQPDPTGAELIVATTLTCAVLERRGEDASVHLAGVGDSGVWVLAGRQVHEDRGR